MNEPEAAGEQRAGTLGMAIFLVSLSILFTATLIGYLVVRFQARAWGAPGTHGLPSGLWASTGIIAACSVAIQRALKAVRGDRPAGLRRWLLATLLLGLAFLACQGANWLALVRLNLPPEAKNLYAFTFYVLTGLHALHVLGGLAGLGAVMAKARRGAYTRESHTGVKLCAMYWHFLGVVWLVLFGTLELTA